MKKLFLSISRYFISLFNSLMLLCTGCSQSYKYGMDPRDRDIPRSLWSQYNQEARASKNATINPKLKYKLNQDRKKRLQEAIDRLPAPHNNFMTNIRYNNIDGIKAALNDNLYQYQSLVVAGLTPIYFAISLQHTEIVKLLLAQKDNRLNEPYRAPDGGEEGDTPLMLAARTNTDILSLLLADPNIDINFSTNGESALKVAIRYRNVANVKLIIEQGKPEFNYFDPSLFETIILTCYLNKLSEDACQPLYAIAKLILDHAKQYNKLNDMLNTPTYIDSVLLLALLCHKEKLVELLLEYGANPNIIGYGHSSLSKLDEKLVKLLEGGANPNMTELDGITPLMLVVKQENVAMFDLLLRYKANLEQLTKRPFGQSFNTLCTALRCAQHKKFKKNSLFMAKKILDKAGFGIWKASLLDVYLNPLLIAYYKNNFDNPDDKDFVHFIITQIVGRKYWQIAEKKLRIITSQTKDAVIIITTYWPNNPELN
ncbi:MAG: ankyrin repeat domain-containing protein [Amoebophilaceae bacterium]|nr:ankyrin repeat domain-containing protein [Amoebophilaceae bacterium]